MIEQDPRYRRRAARLARLLHNSGITDARVLEAFERVPRHLFVDAALRHRAYRDEALPIGLGQTISQPYTVAFQSMQLGLSPGDRVLEVGTGSGYQAAILCAMDVQVFSIERHPELLEAARDILREIGCTATLRVGDGTLGWPAFAPYDGIIVTAGAGKVPDALLQQLRLPADEAGGRAGGRLVIPVGDAESQVMLRITRTGPDTFAREESLRFRFVPLIGADAS